MRFRTTNFPEKVLRDTATRRMREHLIPERLEYLLRKSYTHKRKVGRHLPAIIALETLLDMAARDAYLARWHEVMDYILREHYRPESLPPRRKPTQTQQEPKPPKPKQVKKAPKKEKPSPPPVQANKPDKSPVQFDERQAPLLDAIKSIQGKKEWQEPCYEHGVLTQLGRLLQKSQTKERGKGG